MEDFDHMKHEWIIKFLKLYIKDPNIISLVKKYLKVGVLDNGELMVNEEGSAQGNIISPILAKSRLLQSGAYIARAKQKSGECIRLQTFDFLGFTLYCGRSRKGMPYIMPKICVSLF